MKRRKLTPKLERLFKNLESKYPKLKQCETFYQFRDLDFVDLELVRDFVIGNSLAYVKLGIGCIIFQDSITGYRYLISYKKGKRIIECREERD